MNAYELIKYMKTLPKEDQKVFTAWSFYCEERGKLIGGIGGLVLVFIIGILLV